MGTKSLIDLITEKSRQPLILRNNISCEESVECLCAPAILNYEQEGDEARGKQTSKGANNKSPLCFPSRRGRGKKEKNVAESGHSGSALAVFTSPIPASCSRRRPQSLIAQLRAGLQKDKIEVERERGTNKERERMYITAKRKRNRGNIFFFHEKRGKFG